MTSVASGPAAASALRDFLETSLDDALVGADDEQQAHAHILQLFASVARDVPAYRAFLAERGIDPASIRSIDDFRGLPLVDKRNYVYAHPLAELCRDGSLDRMDMFAVSSGSTGQPTAWPRSTSDARWRSCALRWAPG